MHEDNKVIGNECTVSSLGKTNYSAHTASVVSRQTTDQIDKYHTLVEIRPLATGWTSALKKQLNFNKSIDRSV